MALPLVPVPCGITSFEVWFVPAMSECPLNYDTLKTILKDPHPISWGVTDVYHAFQADPRLAPFADSRILHLACYSRHGVGPPLVRYVRLP